MCRVIFLLIIIWTKIYTYGLMINSVVEIQRREKIYLPALLRAERFVIS